MSKQLKLEGNERRSGRGPKATAAQRYVNILTEGLQVSLDEVNDPRLGILEGQNESGK